MSIILMTTMFYKALILQGEIWCWSLLGLKGLIKFIDLQVDIEFDLPEVINMPSLESILNEV